MMGYQPIGEAGEGIMRLRDDKMVCPKSPRVISSLENTHVAQPADLAPDVVDDLREVARLARAENDPA